MYKVNCTISYKYRLLNILILLALLGTLMACIGQLEFRDISFDPCCSSIVGKKIRLKEGAVAYGVSYEQKLPPDFIILIPGRGIGGWEIVSRTNISKGMIFRITKVLYSTNNNLYLGPQEMRYLVEALDSKLVTTVPIRVYVDGDINDSNLGLDPTYYEIVP